MCITWQDRFGGCRSQWFGVSSQAHSPSQAAPLSLYPASGHMWQSAPALPHHRGRCRVQTHPPPSYNTHTKDPVKITALAVVHALVLSCWLLATIIISRLKHKCVSFKSTSVDEVGQVQSGFLFGYTQEKRYWIFFLVIYKMFWYVWKANDMNVKDCEAPGWAVGLEAGLQLIWCLRGWSAELIFQTLQCEHIHTVLTDFLDAYNRESNQIQTGQGNMIVRDY